MLGRSAFVVVFALVVVVGCTQPEPKPVVYTPENRGPWSEVMPTAPDVTFEQVGDQQRIRVKLDYQKKMGDFVERIVLKDASGTNVGNWKVPGPDAELNVAFLLPKGTQEVTLYVTSSKHGQWRSAPITVPAVKKQPAKP
jgi:hypothetical protein